jgi:hypothetical protein
VNESAAIRWLARRVLAAFAVLGVALVGCTGAAQPPVDALRDAVDEPNWGPGITTASSGSDSRPDAGELEIRLVLLNVTTDTDLRLGAVRVTDGAGIHVEHAGLDPFVERDEDALASPVQRDAVVDSLVLPAQRYVRLRAELRPDCEDPGTPALQITVTDGTTRTDVALDQMASAGGPGWLTDVIDQHCASA